MSDTSWDLLRFALAVYRHGTPERAARMLEVSAATVLRRVAALETYLRGDVFERVDGNYVLTALGEAAIERAEEIDVLLHPLRQQAAGLLSDVDAVVRVTAVPMLVHHALAPAVNMLRARAPTAILELLAEPATLSIARREVDIAVRLARPTGDPNALARKLGVMRYGVYCHRDSADELDAAEWIGHDENRINVPQARWIAAEARSQGRHVPFLTNDHDVSLACLLSGETGTKTLLAHAVAKRFEQLVPVSNYQDVLVEREVWMLVHPGYRARPNVRIAHDWVTTTIESFLSST